LDAQLVDKDLCGGAAGGFGGHSGLNPFFQSFYPAFADR
jgi:hypothetical protein